MKSSELKRLLKASYAKQNKNIGDWHVDPELSGQRARVYKHHKTGEVAVVHRGTKGVHDVITDFRLLLGDRSGQRYKHAEKIQDLAEKKYGTIHHTLGHSLGADIAQNVGKKSKKIVTFNKPVTPLEVFHETPLNQTDVRTQGDVISALHQSPAVTISSNSLNPLVNHSTDSIPEDQVYGGGRKPKNQKDLNQIFKPRLPKYYSKKIQAVMDEMSIEGKYRIIGSGAIQGILYGADIDLASSELDFQDTPESREKILKLFQKKFTSTKRGEYITDLKCGQLPDGSAIRWNKQNIKKGWQMINKKKEYFVDHIMDKSIMKIDFIVLVDGLFIEFSENFYFHIGGEYNYDRDAIQTLPETILEDGRHYYNDKKVYLKAMKRVFSYLQLKKQNEALQIKLLDFFNSQVGLLNKLRADLDTIVILMDQKFKAVPVQHIKVALQQIKQSAMTIGDIAFNGKDLAFDIDKIYDMESKPHIKVEVEKLSESLMDAVNDVAKEFIDKNSAVLKLLKKEKEKKISKKNKQIKNVIEL